jgi:epoxyqueuosine reductase
VNNPNQIVKIIESAGFRAAFLPYNAVEQITAVYTKMLEETSTPQYAKNAEEHFRNNQPPNIPFVPLSFLIVACPSPPGRLVLNVDGKSVNIPIPPIYIDYDGNTKRINEVLASAAEGFKTAHPKGISFKLLAVLSGLGRYGRNNICYVNAFGSHCLLAAFYTDIPFDGMTYEPLKFMDECDECTVCREKCPAHAITDSPVINAEFCPNKYNYSLDPIPENLPKTLFNSLKGCWRCQESCPVNMALPEKELPTLELDGAETQAFLAYETAKPPELEQKLSQFFKCDYLLSVAGRNATLVLRN